MEDDVCESLDKFVPLLKDYTFWEMSTLFQTLYSQLVQQSDMGPSARSKFVWDALNDKEAKTQLKRLVSKFVDKEKVMCVFFFSMLLKRIRERNKVMAFKQFTSFFCCTKNTAYY